MGRGDDREDAGPRPGEQRRAPEVLDPALPHRCARGQGPQADRQGQVPGRRLGRALGHDDADAGWLLKDNNMRLQRKLFVHF